MVKCTFARAHASPRAFLASAGQFDHYGTLSGSFSYNAQEFVKTKFKLCVIPAEQRNPRESSRKGYEDHPSVRFTLKHITA